MTMSSTRAIPPIARITLVGDLASRQHQPVDCWRGQFRRDVRQAVGAIGPFFDQRGDCFGIAVEGDDLVARAHQPPRHVAAHPAQSDHPDSIALLPSSRIATRAIVTGEVMGERAPPGNRAAA